MSVSRKTPLLYPIRAVAQMTGISLDTLRAWERRYEAVTPVRSERGRLYTEADINRLRQLGALVDRGHAIGTVARLDDVQLTRLVESSEALSPGKSEVAAAARLDEITAALDDYDLGVIELAVNRYAAALAPRDLIFAVILPLLNEVGQRWQGGTLRPAQEHLVSAIVRSVLGGLLRVLTRTEAMPRVVFAAPSGERHELGLLCAAVLAAAEGFGVVYLGPDLPAADIWHAATRAEARIVIVSLTTPGVVARTELRALARRPAGVSLWVGGPAASEALPSLGVGTRHIASMKDVMSLLELYAR
jgi:DNA-binding transcriptional MerR regulator/methylmalonyl-CoA mutase cobalamin-binding subunit